MSDSIFCSVAYISYGSDVLSLSCFVSILNEEQLEDVKLHRRISLLSVLDFGLPRLGIHGSIDIHALRETVKLAGVGTDVGQCVLWKIGNERTLFKQNC